MLTIIDVKEKLAEAMIRLVERKPVEKITVKDIVTECHASRQTFYNHFHDKYELINWIYSMKADEILKRFEEEKDWRECMRSLGEYFYQEKAFFMRISAYEGQNSFEQFFLKHTIDYFVSYIENKFGKRELTEELMYSIEFNSAGQVHMCMKWINEGMKIPPERMARYNVMNIPEKLREYL